MSASPRRDTRTILTFILLCVMAFIMYIDRTNIAIAAPLIRKDMGFSNTNLGLIFSAFAIAYSCLMIPGGWLSDRVGARKGLLLFGTIWSIATFLTGAVGSLIMLVIARFCVGVGEAPIYPTAAQLVTRVMAPEQRGVALGVIHASGRTANALAPLIVTALIVAFSWRASFLILGVVTLLYMVVMFGFIRETPQSLGAKPVRLTGVQRDKVNWPDLLRRVWPAAATCFCHGWVLWFFLNWIPSLFAQSYGLNIKHSAVFTTLVLMGGTVGTAAGGLLSDWRLRRTGDRLRARRDVIIFGFLTSILGLIPLLLTHNLDICTGALSFSFFCSELADSPLWVIGSEVSARHSATSAACTFTGMALAGAISPIVVGALLDMTGGNWVVAFAASIFVLLLGPIFAMKIGLEDIGPALPQSKLGLEAERA